MNKKVLAIALICLSMSAYSKEPINIAAYTNWSKPEKNEGANLIPKLLDIFKRFKQTEEVKQVEEDPDRARREAEAKEKEMARDAFYAEAAKESVPNLEYYRYLVNRYGPKIDTRELDDAMKSVVNKHGTYFTLMKWMDEDPTALDQWKAMSPMEQKDVLHETDAIITKVKAEAAIRRSQQ